MGRKFSELRLAPRLACEPGGANVMLSLKADGPAVSGQAARRARELNGRMD